MKIKYLPAIIAVVFLFACGKGNSIVIESIDEELNHQLITGEGLNPKLFSRKHIFQYYQISNSDKEKTRELQAAIDETIRHNYTSAMIASCETFNIHFYRKSIFENYAGEVYEAARDNETGSLDDHRGDKIALVYFQNLDNRTLVRHVILYHKDTILHASTDSVLIN